MVTVSAIATTLFFGGWLRPFPNVAALSFLDLIPGIVWFLGKIFVFMLVYIWFRGTFPRYRFDQLMDLGWKTLIPLALVNLVVIAIAALDGRRGLQILAWILCGGFALALVFITRIRGRKAARATRSAAPAEARA
jgi:NADH-quinone oxidoreductase subunit H